MFRETREFYRRDVPSELLSTVRRRRRVRGRSSSELEEKSLAEGSSDSEPRAGRLLIDPALSGRWRRFLPPESRCCSWSR